MPRTPDTYIDDDLYYEPREARQEVADDYDLDDDIRGEGER
jgi:hypothetical protein